MIQYQNYNKLHIQFLSTSVVTYSKNNVEV